MSDDLDYKKLYEDHKDWWDRWWKEDYSWEGLAKKLWQGWCVLEDGTVVEGYPEDIRNESKKATLQDYWRDQENDLITSPESGKKFTKLHLPFFWEDGNPTPKVDQVVLLKKMLTYSKVTDIDRVILFGHCMRMFADGAIWRRFDVNGLGLELNKDGNYLFNLSAKNCFFSTEISFKTLGPSARFSVFTSEVDFSGSVFLYDTDFSGSNFKFNALFNKVIFFKRVFFNNVNFYKDVFFTGAKFYCNASLAATVFYSKADFTDALFSLNAGFGMSTFLSDAIFRFTQFGRLSLGYTIFAMKADFLGKKNSKNINEQKTDNNILVSDSFDNVSANNAVFFGDAIFDNRQFLESSSFEDCHFYRQASFHGSQLHQGVSFRGVVCEPSLNPSRLYISNEINTPNFASTFFRLNSLKVFDWCNIENRMILKSALEVLKLCAEKFLKLPQRGANIKNHYYGELEACFRTLKQAMEKNGNSNATGHFFKLELLARRKRIDERLVPRWERWLSYAYEWCSDYGNSIFRPLEVLFGKAILFAFIYAALATLNYESPCKINNRFANDTELFETASYSLSRTIPFGPWAKDPSACSPMGKLLNIVPKEEEKKTNKACHTDNKQNAYGPATAFGVSVLATLQSFLAIVLIFLSGLAARRRFQLGG